GSLGPLALAAQLVHAGADGGEVVSSAGPVHGVSSHVGRCFEASDRLTAAERAAILNGLTAGRKPPFHGVGCSPPPSRGRRLGSRSSGVGGLAAGGGGAVAIGPN